MQEQGIVLQKVAEPFANELIELNLANLFLDTANAIINAKKIDFFRYQAIAYLTDAANDNGKGELILSKRKNNFTVVGVNNANTANQTIGKAFLRV